MECVPGVALEIEDASQVGVGDAGIGVAPDLGMSVIGHAEAGRPEHGDVVGPVTHRHRVLGSDPAGEAEAPEGLVLAFRTEERRHQTTGEDAVTNLEGVGLVHVEADEGAHVAGELGEAARHERAEGPVRLHGPDQGPGPGMEPQALAADFVDHPYRHPLQHPHPGFQRLPERDLAGHRPPRELGHLGPDTGVAGELVDALDIDDGAVHIADQKPLPVSGEGQHRVVDGGLLDDAEELGTTGALERARESESAGATGIEPTWPASGETLRPSDQRGIQRPALGRRDQIEEFGHRRPRERTKGVVSRILFIGGTTASGKSALALAIAERTGAMVINADAQQLYRDLAILTARPDAAEEARAEHRLYGILPPDAASSAGWWLERVLPVLEEAESRSLPVILVGGTGFYMKALLEGLAPVPPIPPEIRHRLRALDLPAPELHRRLEARDPVTAARLRPRDRQRILRALEVVEATGRPLAAWQSETRPRIDLAGRVRGVALLPAREDVQERILRRLDAMLAAGALEELAALARERPDLATLPIARVHGCREFLAHLAGRVTLEEARRRTVEVTRRYAKRQRTFFRHQFAGFTLLEELGETAERRADALGRWLGGRDGASC